MVGYVGYEYEYEYLVLGNEIIYVVGYGLRLREGLRQDFLSIRAL